MTTLGPATLQQAESALQTAQSEPDPLQGQHARSAADIVGEVTDNNASASARRQLRAEREHAQEPGIPI